MHARVQPLGLLLDLLLDTVHAGLSLRLAIGDLLFSLFLYFSQLLDLLLNATCRDNQIDGQVSFVQRQKQE